MKTALIVLAALSVFGCTADDMRSPTSPSSTHPPTSFPPTVPAPGPQGNTASVWGMVIQENGICIVDGAVEVLSGQLAGTKVKQDPNCNYWGYSGGFTFVNLTPGLPMTIRATAPGYDSLEETIMPMSGPYTIFAFELKKSSFD